jgi:uncharacterized protein DUF2188
MRLSSRFSPADERSGRRAVTSSQPIALSEVGEVLAMPRPRLYVVRSTGTWSVIRAGAVAAISRHATRNEAVAAARSIIATDGSTLLVLGEDEVAAPSPEPLWEKLD